MEESELEDIKVGQERGKGKERREKREELETFGQS